MMAVCQFTALVAVLCATYVASSDFSDVMGGIIDDVNTVLDDVKEIKRDAPASCTDLKWNGDEDGIDCGGSCDYTCATPACSGADAKLPVEFPKHTCDLVKLYKDIEDRKICEMVKGFGIGKPITFWDKNGPNVAMICEVITRILESITPLPLPDSICSAAMKSVTSVLNWAATGQGTGSPDWSEFSADLSGILESILNDVVESLKTGVEAFQTFFDSMSFCPAVNVGRIRDAVVAIPKLFKSVAGGTNWLRSQATEIKDAYTECKTYSLLLTYDLDLLNFGKQLGIYATFNEDGIKEFGLLNGFSASSDISSPDMDVGAGGTLAFLMGDKSVWGEWGWSFDLGGTVPVMGAAVGVTFSIIFTGNAETKKLENYVGFSIYSTIAFGEASAKPDIDVSLTCGHMAANTIAGWIKDLTTCATKKETLANNWRINVKEMVTKLEEGLDRRIDEMKRCGNVYKCQAAKCAYNIEKYASVSKVSDKLGQCGSSFDTCLDIGKCEVAEIKCGIKWGSCSWWDVVCHVQSLISIWKDTKWSTRCFGSGWEAIKDTWRCTKMIPSCANEALNRGVCYVKSFSDVGTAVLSCTGGFVVPAQKCLTDNGF